ncbi:MAG: bifunctional glycosyltransferase family 2/GtrA family protein [Solobacterium sp.]|nr:bifunctional glycosyltransferase family 2/GtrA family protein [Solobacterium sp.]
MNTYTVLIPAYCPGKGLIGLVEALKERNMECIVVNDGSPEEYDSVFQSVSDSAVVLAHEINKGKGAAMKTGFAYIRDHYNDCIVVTADADGQHLPVDIQHIAECAESAYGSLVLGTRSFKKEDVPFKSYYGNKITETVFRTFTGVHVHDTQTGLRAFHSSLIDTMLKVPGDRYEYEMNKLLRCVKEKIPFQETEITTVYEDNNSCSHFHPFRDSFLIYKQILRFGLSSIASFFVDLCAFEIFTLFCKGSTGILASNILARLISATFNYEINRKAVFNDQSTRKKSIMKYAALALTILACNTAILYLLTGILHMNPLFAKVLTEMILFIFSWTIQNKYIFTNHTERMVNQS